MTFRFSQRSEQNLQGVRPDLVAVVRNFAMRWIGKKVEE